MFWLIKQVFIVSLSFSGSLAIKYVSLNNKSYMTRATFIDLSLFQINYYSFMIM